jgi:hypothetical protein
VAGAGDLARIVNSAASRAITTMRAAFLALGLLLTPPVSSAIDAISDAVTSVAPAHVANFSFISAAQGQPKNMGSE